MTSNEPGDSVARGVKNGWFSEVDSMLPGQKFSLALQVRAVYSTLGSALMLLQLVIRAHHTFIHA